MCEFQSSELSKAVIKLLHHTFEIMCGRSLADFVPQKEHWLTLDNLGEVQLPPVAERPLIRCVCWLHSWTGHDVECVSGSGCVRVR